MPARSWPSVVLALVVVAAACGTADQAAPPGPTDAATISAAAVETVTSPAPSVATTGPSTLPETSATTEATVDSAASSTSSTESSTATSAQESGATTTAAPIELRIRLERRVDDAATEGFADFAAAVLTDERGWQQAGFRFVFSDTDYDYTVVLAEGAAVDELCLPYDTFGRFSCQIGPVVALNADRWRTAVDSWPASLDAYRTMLVNHEVGHLTGQHHPAVRCPGDGQPAPVMAQQSSGVAPCTANPWPLPWEIACAALGLEPIAPGYERDIQLTCGPDGPVS